MNAPLEPSSPEPAATVGRGAWDRPLSTALPAPRPTARLPPPGAAAAAADASAAASAAAGAADAGAGAADAGPRTNFPHCCFWTASRRRRTRRRRWRTRKAGPAERGWVYLALARCLRLQQGQPRSGAKCCLSLPWRRRRCWWPNLSCRQSRRRCRPVRGRAWRLCVWLGALKTAFRRRLG